MQTVLDDARESYETDIIVELQSESTEDLEGNVQRIVLWIDAWLKNNAESS
jgi:adenylate kinase